MRWFQSLASSPSLTPSTFDKSNFSKHSPVLSCPRKSLSIKFPALSARDIPGLVNAGRDASLYTCQEERKETSPPPQLPSSPTPSPHPRGPPGTFRHSLSLFIKPHLGQQNLDCGLFPTRRTSLRGGHGEQNTRFFRGAGRWLTGQAPENPTETKEPHAIEGK